MLHKGVTLLPTIAFFILLTLTSLHAQTLSQEELDKLKEQIKQEILQQLRSGELPPSAETTRAQAPSTMQSELDRARGHDLRSIVRDDVLESSRTGDGFFAKAIDHFAFDLLVETGAVSESTKYKNGETRDRSSFALTTVEMALGFKPIDWVGADVVLLYEDPTFDEASGFDVDAASITIGNTDKFPLFLTAGMLYVPFGALYTHLPDDPLIDSPLTLSLGQTRAAALLLGARWRGLSFSAYVFNGDVDKAGSDDNIDSHGFDANYEWGDSKDGGVALKVGASYISDIADSDGITDVLGADIRRSIGGFDGYFHADYAGFFLLGEYMTALRSFDYEELPESEGSGAQPSVWTVEAGYAFDWWNTLELVLHYSGSREGGALGLPESRLGFGFNQTLFPGVVISVGYLRDTYHDNDVDERDYRNLVLSQLSFVF